MARAITMSARMAIAVICARESHTSSKSATFGMIAAKSRTSRPPDSMPLRTLNSTERGPGGAPSASAGSRAAPSCATLMAPHAGSSPRTLGREGAAEPHP